MTTYYQNNDGCSLSIIKFYLGGPSKCMMVWVHILKHPNLYEQEGTQQLPNLKIWIKLKESTGK